jgi:hypothetical protein
VVKGGRVRRTVVRLACLAASVGLLAAATSCSSSPPQGPPPLLPSTGTTHESTVTPPQPGFDARGLVKLPSTIELTFFYPTYMSATEHTVMFTIQEGLKAQLAAIYAGRVTDPPLLRYWTGHGLDSAAAGVRSWITEGYEPVGQMIIDRVTEQYLTVNSAEVSFCVDTRYVDRAKKSTHVIGPPLQGKDDPGQWQTLLLKPLASPDQGWVIVRFNAVQRAPQCPPVNRTNS